MRYWVGIVCSIGHGWRIIVYGFGYGVVYGIGWGIVYGIYIYILSGGLSYFYGVYGS